MTMFNEAHTSRMTLLARLSAFAAALGGMRRSRTVLRDLDALDDNLLRDIGLSRGDMLDIRSAPLSSDPDAVLRRARMRNMF
ncbi:DUF1127 domain-containing protein [Rhizobium sp. LjRoot254]|uniref:DUF1127 domain-containing protein n=1 Tax=Rhizobium sp. LjRoot254 TaxID=3342297 RepID=UPI003ED14FF0